VTDNICLTMRDICKIFPGVVALDQVSFELRRGEVHILLGENGAGKSTLVKILSGAYRKTSGSISLYGLETDFVDPSQAQTKGIATIYQEFNLIPHLTVAENIFLGREATYFSGILDQKAMNIKAQALLNELGVQINAERQVRMLGVAEQQMVEVAKALSLDASILIMDEPTSALTEKEINELFLTIRKLKKNGVSIIYISHRMEELFEIGDRVTVLRDGKHVATCPIAETNKDALIRMMVDRELKEHYPRQKPSKGDEILRIENLNISPVLKNINLVLCRGEILGIAGLLGSGRTELARAIFGLDKPDTGTFYVRGELAQISSPAKAIDLKIGFLTEDRKQQGLVLDLSLKDNICLPSVKRLSHFGVVNNREETEIAEYYIKELSIRTPGIMQKVLYLSGGNQQKVVICKWLCSQAEILIFDEPTRGIDVASKVEIYQLMNDLTARGAAVLMISSDLPEIMGMSDRILVMHEGKINAEYSNAEVTQEKILQSALGAA